MDGAGERFTRETVLVVAQLSIVPAGGLIGPGAAALAGHFLDE
jgi:hypothetical protein